MSSAGIHNPISTDRLADPPRCIALTPFETPNLALARALQRTSALSVLSLGRDRAQAAALLQDLSRAGRPVAVQLFAPFADSLPSCVAWLVLDRPGPIEAFRDRPRRVLVQVCDVREARAAAEAGADGLIVKGCEAAGRAGEESTPVLLQRVLSAVDVPVWAQGGIGPRGAAAVIAAGARGYVLDTQLACVRETGLERALATALAALDGSEIRRVLGHNVYIRRDAPQPDESLGPEQLIARLGTDLQRCWLPIGGDAGLASWLGDRHGSAAALVRGYERAVDGYRAVARRVDPFGPGARLARELGVRHPIVQGPMTRVSDRAAFAAAIADAGGIPFVALSLLTGEAARRVLTETAARLGDRAWGVGILGFVPKEIQEEQIALVREVGVRLALIAGGRPAQARALEADGIETYLHVPSPGLLDLYLKEGATKFVFEGRECGGHVGPRTSLVLWEVALARLLEVDNPHDLSVLFAGGIHDDRSAAMAAVFAAPLAERGARVGALMGTAYLFTAEAVQSGAVVPEFQAQALRCDATVLFETGPGHATRAADSEYVQHFRAEHARMRAAGSDPKQIWAALEQMNLGRLRIATKGLAHDEQGLVELDHEQQRAQGLYMMGQVAALRDRVTSMAALHDEVGPGSGRFLRAHVPAPPALDADRSGATNRSRDADIAIVGMACIMPEACDLHEFFRNIVLGKNCVGEVPESRWARSSYYDPKGGADRTHSKWGAFIPPQIFDPREFGIPPRSVPSIDPGQLLTLMTVKRALLDAGLDAEEFGDERTSIVVGGETSSDTGAAHAIRAHLPQLLGSLPQALADHLPILTEDTFPGVLVNVVAGRVANRFNFGGLNCVVQAACASSLAAAEAACKELILGNSDLAIACGVDLNNGIADYLLFSSVHALSPRGQCRAFDASADGIVLGEGVAAVVLKRLDDARRDGDRVYAVLKSVAGSSDGRSLGLTAPLKQGQELALSRAYERSGIAAMDVQMIEAHGTGTVLGDRTELACLTDFMGDSGARPGSCTLGSVKSSIGHTKSAAGMAGLIKTALSVYYGVLPPTSLIEKPNPYYRSEQSPFVFRDRPRPWLSPRRRAGVSAFGFGGTNFHAVVEDAGQAPDGALQAWPRELVVLRGADLDAARRMAQRLLAWADAEQPFSLAQLAASAARAERDQPVQLAFATDSLQDLRLKLKAICGAGELPVGVHGRRHGAGDGRGDGRLAFLFPGQGSQRLHMLADLFVFFPRLQHHLLPHRELADKIYPPMVFDDAQRDARQAALADTRVAQPALGVTSMAVAEWLSDLGVRADMVAGHSYGELSALCYAGALSESQLIELSHERASAMLQSAGDDPGTMAAVQAAEHDVAQAIAGIDGVVIANINGPAQTVISGASPAVAAAIEALNRAGLPSRRIPVAAGFHSPLMAGARTAFEAALQRISIAAPELPVWSNVTAQPHDGDAASIARALCAQLASPVLFARQIESMYAAGARVFVEVGPGSVLTGLVGRILDGRPHTAVATDRSSGTGIDALVDALARLSACGVDVATDELFEGRAAGAPDLLRDDPPALPATAYVVDGHRARPARGPQLENGLKVLDGPLALSLASPSPLLAAGTREQAVLDYLQSTRDLIEGQRQVMLRYLGAGTAEAPAEARKPASVDRSAQPRRAEPSDVAPAAAPPAIRPAERLLALLSERTGYPVEMLEPGLDLEADLGVDSIKRVEIFGLLAEQLGLPVEQARGGLIEELAQKRTLSAIQQWLEEQIPQPATTGGVDPARVAAAPAPRAPGELLIALLSQRTGYPEDMLDRSLDLEADLGIDSIKRVEILAAVLEQLGGAVPRDAAAPELEELAGRKTLEQIIAFLEQRFGQAATQPQSVASAQVASEPARGLTRLVLQLQPARIEARNELAGRCFAVRGNGDGPVRQAVIEELERNGARVSEARDTADGVIYLALSDGDPCLRDTDPAKALFRALQRELAPQVRTLLVAHTPDAGGIAGFIKCVAQERDCLSVRSVQFERGVEPAALGRQLVDELAITGAHPEIAYVDGERCEPRLVARARDGSREIPLCEQSVILLTGGARGITARVSLEFARRYRCHIELIGRSPLPVEGESPVTASCPDAASIRRALIRASDERMSPAEIERRCQALLSAREIRATLEGIRQAGGRVRYHQADVRDRDAMKRVVEDVYARHERIDGLVHGAGVLRDKLLEEKSSDAFDLVYDTKVEGARALLDQLRDDTRFVAFFSSVSSVYGNRGQTDYAAANDYLDRLSLQLARMSDRRVLSVNWGPWGGIGMVTPELQRAYGRRGIGLIDPDEGAGQFVEELVHGREPQVILMAPSTGKTIDG